MNRVLITGGAGFIAYHLSNLLLESGYQLTLVDSFYRGVQDPYLDRLVEKDSVTLEKKDLLRDDLSDLGQFEYIFHLAAVIGVANVLERPYEVLTDNVEMHRKMLEFAKTQENLKRFVFTSTSEVYAGTLKYFDLPIPTPEDTPLAVTDPAHPRTTYMLSKIYGEAMCHQSEVPFTIVRPHNFYGPRMGLSHVIPELLKKAREAPAGEKLEVFSVDHQRTFCYIGDAVKIIKGIAESDKALNGVYNVGTETPEVTIRELAEIILATVGRDLEIDPQPETPGSPRRRCPCMKKTIAASRHVPQIGVREGVQLTYDWYLDNVFENENAVSAK